MESDNKFIKTYITCTCNKSRYVKAQSLHLREFNHNPNIIPVNAHLPCRMFSSLYLFSDFLASIHLPECICSCKI